MVAMDINLHWTVQQVFQGEIERGEHCVEGSMVHLQRHNGEELVLHSKITLMKHTLKSNDMKLSAGVNALRLGLTRHGQADLPGEQLSS